MAKIKKANKEGTTNADIAMGIEECLLMVGVQTGVTTMEISVNTQKTRNRLS